MSDPVVGTGSPTRRVLAVIPARGGSKGVPAKNETVRGAVGEGDVARVSRP